MNETIQTIIQWHEKTFPDATLEGQLRKYEEEILECNDSKQDDISELADVFIVACGIARFSLVEALVAFSRIKTRLSISNKFDRYDLFVAINAKMKVNRSRTWEKTDGLYKHESK